MRPTFDLNAIETLSPAEIAAVLVRVAARLAVLGRPAPVSRDKLLTAKQLATELSYSLDTVYDMARTGRIPVVRHGRSVRFDLEAARHALTAD